MHVNNSSPVAQAAQNSFEALKDKERIAKLKVMKSKLLVDHRLLSEIMDNLPPLATTRQKYGELTPTLVDYRV
jgi:hypothetical protein